MKEVLQDIERWRRAGLRVATARVVGLDGSGPRQPGAAMVVSETGEVAGSVSGGCVEGAVVTEALQVLQGGGGARRCTFGYSDDEAFAVGLTCGGTIHVLVDGELPAVFDELSRALRDEEPVALATVVELADDGPAGDDPPGGTSGAGDDLPGATSGSGASGGSGANGAGGLPGASGRSGAGDGDAAPVALGASLLVHQDGSSDGSLGSAGLDEVVRRDALGSLASGLSAVRHYGRCGQARERSVGVFVEVFAPPPRMVIFGAVDFTAALARMAKVLGYRVTVCDARAVFATRQRFPMADDVVVDRPDRLLAAVGPTLGRRDAVCVLTHDPKFDVPAIVAALGTDVGYLGVMGSRRTHADRVERLRREGVGPDRLARVMAPIGLDIGARTPEETAVSIVAEIIALRAGRPAPSLRDRDGPIHQAEHHAAAR